MLESVQRCNCVNQNGVQCGMPMHHPGGHGNGLLTTPRDEWHAFVGDDLKVFATSKDTIQYQKFGNVWTVQSVNQRCLWMGTTSRCIYELEHTLPHKEDV